MTGNSEPVPAEKDRKVGLVIFGVIEVLFGLLCAAFVPLMVFAMVVSTAAGEAAGAPGIGMMVPGLLFYAALAVWFTWMGIGSILTRRWARALLLVTSWFMFVSGVMGLFFMVFFMRDMYAEMGASGQMPARMAGIMEAVTVAIMLIFYVIVPGVLILFYGSRHVKATCERRDAKTRWTDRCPLPVLGVSIPAVLGAASVPTMGCYGWAVPCFGRIITGAAGAGVVLVGMLLMLYVAWGTYRLRIAAWWCAALGMAAAGLSSIVTFARVDLMELYAHMNFPPDQLAQMEMIVPPMGQWIVLFTAVWIIIVLGYLAWIRRYFTPAPFNKQEPAG